MESTDMEVTVVTILPDGRMTTRNAALYLGLSAKTLAMMRTYGTGPKFVKKGRIFYFREDLDTWVNSSGRGTSTAQLKAGQPLGG